VQALGPATQARFGSCVPILHDEHHRQQIDGRQKIEDTRYESDQTEHLSKLSKALKQAINNCYIARSVRGLALIHHRAALGIYR
jgi:hypothetical protein